jgi:transmembrane sensor
MNGGVMQSLEEIRLEAASVWCLALCEGELSPAEEARFSTWLAADPANRLAFDEAVAIWDGVGETDLSPAVLALRREALSGFEQRRRRHGRPRHWYESLQRLAAVLMVGLMLLGGGTWLGLRPQVIQTGVGERRIVVFDDGSKVSLDASTRVRVRYDRHQRRLWLDQGRAKFDVAHNAQRPFTVQAADRIVRATGTQFSVELLREDIHVVLYEGQVIVRPLNQQNRPPPAKSDADTVAPSRQAILAPGEELTARARSEKVQLASADPVRSLAWEAGQLIFVDEPLASAVERVNRYSTTKLVIDDAQAAKLRVDAVFTAGDTEAFIEGVAGILPVRVLRTQDAVHFAGAGQFSGSRAE